MRAKHEKMSLKTPDLEQEMEEKLAGVSEAQGNKAGEQEETECPRAQSPGREAALAWASLAQRSPASSVLARASGCIIAILQMR